MTSRSKSCLDDEQLVNALLDERGGARSGELTHLRRCAGCAARGESWERTLGLASQDARAAVPAAPMDLEASIRRAVSITAQTGRPAEVVVGRAGFAWWTRVADWVTSPAVWRPAVAGGLALCVVAGVWIVRPDGPRSDTAAVEVREPAVVPAAVPSSSASPSSIALGEGSVATPPALRRRRTAAGYASSAPAPQTLPADWADWDDATVDAVGALAQTSLGRAVAGSVEGPEGEGGTFLQTDDWSALSDLTPEQHAWLAAELAKRIGG